MTPQNPSRDRLSFALYVPGMPFHGGSIAAGESLGGSESAGYYLARELARRGHETNVFSELSPEETGAWEGVAYRALGPRTERTPFGADFEAFAASVPCDVLLGQRAPGLFHRPTQAKVNLWWAHDLALKRHQGAFNRQVWNLNGVLCVSEFHRRQLAEVYGLRPEAVHVVPNGVDRSLFRAAPGALPGTGPGTVPGAAAKQAGRVLVYSSRPERGLEHLVGGTDGAPGIMETLWAADPSIQLRVCAYDNVTPALADYYAFLQERCRALPNVQWLGALSKVELAALLGGAWLHAYPTTFEEVSCIAAMEAQCAGTPVVTSPVAALPETLSGAGARWVPLAADGTVDRAAFAQAVLELRDAAPWEALHRASLAAAPRYDWTHAAEAVEDLVVGCLRRQTSGTRRLGRHLLRHSDIFALKTLLELRPDPALRAEVETHYAFAEGGQAGMAAHYDAQAAWEAERGLDHGLGGEHFFHMLRFRPALEQVRQLPDGAAVLDYGCGPGHFTVALARRFPRLRFTGVDLSAAHIARGRAFLGREPLPNLALYPAGEAPEERHDLVISTEVLEHTLDPAATAETLEGWVKPGGLLLITVPYGPWEEESFAERPHRAHLHHLERQDLLDLWGKKPGFQLDYVAQRHTARGEILGHHVALWRPEPGHAPGRIDLGRKLRVQRPRETLAVCMVVRPEGDSLARCLKSVRGLAEQIVIGIDGEAGAERGAWTLARDFGAEAFTLPSPLRTGFDAARNATLDRAAADWILWIDDDEELLWPERLAKYLRDNPYDAYAVPQHHFAVEPGGVIKTDYPCRLFRNGRGFRFFGVVHEHPELGLNQGPGRCLVLPDVAICHNGYLTEDVRRARFRRNLPLMLRDREQYRERALGKFLWIRDLAHLNRFEHEQTGAVSPRMRSQAEEGVALWRELLGQGQVRLAVDALPYYSECAGLLTGAPIAFDLALAGNRLGVGDPPGQPPVLRGQFAAVDDIQRLTQALLKEKLDGLGGKYM